MYAVLFRVSRDTRGSPELHESNGLVRGEMPYRVNEVDMKFYFKRVGGYVTLRYYLRYQWQYKIVNIFKQNIIRRIRYLWHCIILRKNPRIYFFSDSLGVDLSTVVYPWNGKCYDEGLELENWRDWLSLYKNS